MGFKTILTEVRDFINGINIGSAATGWYGGVPSAAGVRVTSQNSLMSPPVFGCVRIISAIIARTDLHVYEYFPDGGRRIATEHPLEHLLNVAPNDEMDAYIAKETSQGHLLLDGNCYYKITRDRSRRITELYPLLPTATTPYRNGQQGPLVYQYVDPWSGQTDILTADEVLHIKNISWEGLVGMSPIQQYAREAFGLDLGLRTYGSKYLANGASGSIVMSLKGRVSPEDRKLYENDLKQAHSGVNAHRAFVVSEGGEIKNLSLTPEESQFLETRGFQRDEIANCIFGVPSYLVGGKEDSQAGISEQNSALFQNTVSSWCSRWTSAMNAKFFSAKPKTKWEDSSKYTIDFDTADLRRFALIELLKTIATGRQWGIVSISEGRTLMGMNPFDTSKDKDYTNQLLRPVNMIPETNDPPPVAPVPAPNAVNPPAPDHAGGAQVVEDVARNLYRGVFEDAFKRVLTREKRDEKVIRNAFNAPLFAIADYFAMTLNEEHRAGDQLSDDITEFIAGYVGSMAQRAKTWENDAIIPELNRAITELRNKIHQEIENGK